MTQQGVRTVRAGYANARAGHRPLPVLGPRSEAADCGERFTRLTRPLSVLVAFVMFVAANLAIALAGALGWIVIVNEFLAFLPAGPVRNVTMLLVGSAPSSCC